MTTCTGWIAGTDPQSPMIRRFSELISVCLKDWAARGVQPTQEECARCVAEAQETTHAEFNEKGEPR